MTKRVSEILYEMAAEEGFYFLDIERFCKKNKDEIQKLNTIFDTDDDRNDEIMDVVHYLISKTFGNFENYEKPENFENDKNLVLAAFIENQSFFSMCWNYMLMEKHKVKIVPKKISTSPFVFSFDKYWEKNLDEEVFVAAAGKFGFNNLTSLSIEGIGSLKVFGNEQTNRLYFAVSLEDEVKTKELEISIILEINREEKKAIILKDYEDEENDVSSDPVPIDFSTEFNFKIKNISYKPL